MDQQEMEETVRMRDRLAAEIDRDRAALIIKEQIVQGLNDLITLDGPPKSQENPQQRPQSRRRSGDPLHPKGIEAIRRVLAESPLERMDVKRIVAELEQRGWLPDSTDPVNATSSAASRTAETFPGVQRERIPGSVAYAYWYEPEMASVLSGPVSDYDREAVAT